MDYGIAHFVNSLKKNTHFVFLISLDRDLKQGLR